MARWELPHSHAESGVVNPAVGIVGATGAVCLLYTSTRPLPGRKCGDVVTELRCAQSQAHRRQLGLELVAVMDLTEKLNPVDVRNRPAHRDSLPPTNCPALPILTRQNRYQSRFCPPPWLAIRCRIGPRIPMSELRNNKQGALDRRVAVATIYAALCHAVLSRIGHPSVLLQIMPEPWRGPHIQLSVRALWAALHLLFYAIIPWTVAKGMFAPASASIT